MNWNEITEGINHIPGSHITLRTEPNMKVDIDGEINLETPITIDVLPKAINILTFRMMRNNNYIIIKGMYECFKLHTYLYFNYYLKHCFYIFPAIHSFKTCFIYIMCSRKDNRFSFKNLKLTRIIIY